MQVWHWPEEGAVFYLCNNPMGINRMEEILTPLSINYFYSPLISILVKNSAHELLVSLWDQSTSLTVLTLYVRYCRHKMTMTFGFLVCGNWTSQAQPNQCFRIRPAQADAGEGRSWGCWLKREKTRRTPGTPGSWEIVQWDTEGRLGRYSLCLGLRE